MPDGAYEELVGLVTKGLNCKEITCYYASVDAFPDLEFKLAPVLSPR